MLRQSINELQNRNLPELSQNCVVQTFCVEFRLEISLSTQDRTTICVGRGEQMGRIGGAQLGVRWRAGCQELALLSIFAARQRQIRRCSQLGV